MDFLKRSFLGDPVLWCACIVAAVLLVLVAATSGSYAAPQLTSEAESLRYLRPGYPTTSYSVSVGAASAEASTVALPPWSRIRVSCKAAVHFAMGIFGATTATASSPYLGANVVESLRTANTGAVDSVALIRDAADTTCTVTVME